MGRTTNRETEQRKQEIMYRFNAAWEEEKRIRTEANARIKYYQDLREELYRQYKALERK